ncbi:hypothetical protein CVD25_02170 [Bacillus canaveralius]|uniref:Uncharacterized protein n=1 Tax=Bacillus canaveralius TaxID=1403243 RepID=A0A2N5GPH4_9BACI|nr:MULTISPECIES: hypothetical protein [Bacillus]PLR84421.1 hypothetical protein CU635_06625 [Bacillus canaveralius]PLR86994.1 hypothetical protein CVD23_05000 [Bacillus sp. V33-4]PLS00577.1 hypothetical protein CVD25_02170 [Bacillus canaveralius]RSK57862.1 hypothetical protein EJA13_00375 [Bacillus canaveralius]
MTDACIYCGKELAFWQRDRPYCTTCRAAVEEAYIDYLYMNEYDYDPYFYDRDDLREYEDKF